MIEKLDHLSRHGATDAEKQMILQLAETTRSDKVRDAAALAMADLRIDGAGQLLLRLIGRGDTKDHRGTLMYALEEIGEKAPLPLLVAALLDGGYEAREQALDLLGKEQVACTAEELNAAIAALGTLAASDNDYASVVGRTAVRWLKSLQRKRK